MNDPKIPRLDTDNEYRQTIPDGGDAYLAEKWANMPRQAMQSDGQGNWRPVGPPTAPMTPEGTAMILELAQQVIALLLYFARAAHDKNPTAPAQVPFASLPQAWQADFAGVAQMAVNSLEADKRQAAERAALIHAERWLEAEAIAVVNDGEPTVPHGNLRYFIDALVRTESPNIVTEVLAAYQEALCQK